MDQHSILLIEDNVKLASLIERYITPHGFHFQHVMNVQELTELTDTQFDLIICDVMLPDGDGFRLFPKLRELSSSPIIYLTALSDVKDQIKGLELGASDYIVKPVDPQLLLARIKSNLRKQNVETSSNKIVIGDLLVDKTSEIVSYQGHKIKLYPS